MNWLKSKGLLYFIRLGMMSVLTGFNFWLAVVRWGWLDPDPRVKVSAVIVAGGTELGLLAFLVLFHQRFYTPDRRVHRLLGWGIGAALAIVISLYVNIGYFSRWPDPDGNADIDLAIRGFVPMIFLIGFSMIPPKQQKVRTAADVQREYEARIAEAQMKQQLAEIEQQARNKRRDDAAKERAKQAMLLRLAGRDLAREYEAVTPDEDIIMDWQGLEMDLRARGLYPPQPSGLAALPTTEEMLAVGVAESPSDDAQDEDDERSASGNHRAYINAEEVAEILGVSAAVAARMMAARSAHPYAIKNCKNIRLRKPVRGRSYERRAPYAQVLEIKDKMEADRQAKVRPFPQPELQAQA